MSKKATAPKITTKGIMALLEFEPVIPTEKKEINVLKNNGNILPTMVRRNIYDIATVFLSPPRIKLYTKENV